MPDPVVKLASRLNSPKWQTGIFFLLLVAWITPIYFPSLYHIPRSDHIVYLANTSQVEGPALVTQFYSYDRTPHLYNLYYDAVLFRPLFLAFLGLEKWVWGDNFMLWQITGILLHLAFVWNLLRLLLTLQRSIFAFYFMLFYASLFVGSEMVIWQHVNAYMIYLNLVLIALRKLYLMTTAKRLSRNDLIILLACLFPMSFLYEAGFLVSIACFIYVTWISRKPTEGSARSYLWLLLVPPALYISTYVWDLHIHHLGASVIPTAIPGINLTSAIEHFLLAIYWWLFAGLFPLHLIIIAIQRPEFIVPPPAMFLEQLSSSGIFIKLLAYNAVALMAAVCLMVMNRVNRAFIRTRRPFVCLVGGLLFLHVALIVMGRLNGRDFLGILAHTAYYASFFWVFLIALVYSLIDFNYFTQKHRIFTLNLIICCLAITVISSRLVLHLNDLIRNNSRQQRSVLCDIRQHIQANKTRQPFTFAVYPKGPQDIPWIHRSDGTPGHNNYFELLYLKNYDEANPTCTYELCKTDFVRRCRSQ